MSKFYLPSTSTTAASTPAAKDSRSQTYFSSPTHSPISENPYDSDDDNDLPFPTELPRNDFLAPEFDPQTYLSSLRNRHQTLEDLRSDLRQRSQLLNRELLDLVNGNYEEFLSLGGDLKGGEERVEGVRVGVLGFRREIEGVRSKVLERQREVGELVRERKERSRDVAIGRGLLEVEDRLVDLEGGLGLGEGEEGMEDEHDEEFDEDEDESVESSSLSARQIRRLERHTQQFVLLLRLVERLGSNHPFLQGRRSRIEAVRKTVLLDLAAALRQAKSEGRSEDVLRVVRLYGILGAEAEGVKTLKGS